MCVCAGSGSSAVNCLIRALGFKINIILRLLQVKILKSLKKLLNFNRRCHMLFTPLACAAN